MLCALATRAASGEPTLAIDGATLIDGTGAPPVQEAVVLIERGRILWAGPSAGVEIPSGTLRIQAQDLYLIPGLADMHHHLTPGYAPGGDDEAPVNLARLLRWGVTSVFAPHAPTLESFRVLKIVSAPDSAPTPRYYGTGPMITAPGGHFSTRAAGGLVADSPERARIIVRDLRAAGVDAIKFVYDDLQTFLPQSLRIMDLRTMASLVDEAHAQGLRAYAHAPVLEYAKLALRAGADGLVHGVMSDLVDEEFIALMRRNGAVYVSTQSLYVCFNDPEAWVDRLRYFDRRKTIPPDVLEAVRRSLANSPFRVSDRHLANSLDNLVRVHQAGIPVIAGTDSGVVGVVSGLSSQIEVALLVEAGLSPTEALKSATVRAAAMIGRDSEVGSIVAGKRADLVLLEADPLADIRNLSRVVGVLRGGVVYGDPVRLGFPAAKPFPGETR